MASNYSKMFKALIQIAIALDESVLIIIMIPGIVIVQNQMDGLKVFNLLIFFEHWRHKIFYMRVLSIEVPLKQEIYLHRFFGWATGKFTSLLWCIYKKVFIQQWQPGTWWGKEAVLEELNNTEIRTQSQKDTFTIPPVLLHHQKENN